MPFGWTAKLKGLVQFKSCAKIKGYVKIINDIKVKDYVKNIPWKSPQVVMTGIIAVFFSLTGILYFNTTANVTVVSVNGQEIGLTDALGQAESMLETVLQEKGQLAGLTAKTRDKVEFEEIRIKKGVLLEKKRLSEDDLAKVLDIYVDGAEIKLDDERLLALAGVDEADRVLEEYKNYYVHPSESNVVETVYFKENVQAAAAEVRPEEVKTPEDALQMLLDGRKTADVYTVQEDDSWWLIARKNDMKTKEVLEANPGNTEDSHLQVGQKINLVAVEPYILVVVKGVYKENETIPFDVVFTSDSSLGSGVTVVQQEGLDGNKLVTYAYEQENGQDKTKTIVAETVTQATKDQIIAKGPARAASTGTVATSRGSGSVSGLSWPLQGRFTSYYGYRVGDFHTGIDIDGDTGDPFTAAAGGVVVSAGWNGTYGYSILIDHGNGVATRYAHASKLLVSAGQTVNKGETIALVGSTGNSTGSHLHFEIIINGETVNPLNYMR
ncbi:MAG: peptidoglycan DD-metalloendopeptidase family protein [Peptococcaceae bacterium]|nr:peptidoglycan DD-metalloendopeptidase family protein [Peptococcaceae bacterium]